MSRRQTTYISLIATGVALLTLLTGAMWLAYYVATNPALQATIASWGYLGVVIVATVAGLNVVIPVPAASFTPVFIAAGMEIWPIIFWLTVGTLIADLIGYVFGRLGRTSLINSHPKIFTYFEQLYTNHRHWLIPAIFIYAALFPAPNEIMILPLALLGVPWRVMVLPLFFGNFINQTMYAFGIHNAFLWFF